MQINKIQNQPAFTARLNLSGDIDILKPNEIKELAKKAKKIAGENDTINFHIDYLDWSTKSVPQKDGKNDILTVFSRNILANCKINGNESRQKNLTMFLTDETHNCKWLPEDSVLNRPFEYMSRYMDKFAEKFPHV